jgi:hypothetical protein
LSFTSPSPTVARGQPAPHSFLASAQKLVQNRTPVKLAQCTIFSRHHLNVRKRKTLIRNKADLTVPAIPATCKH